MKIAFIVAAFPTVSETFVLNQITGLIELGHEVDIYAGRPGDISKIHPDVEKYHLLERTYYTRRPNNFAWRIVKAFIWLITNFSKYSVPLLESLNFFKYGRQAVSLELFYGTLMFLKHQQNYDIIYCHFGPVALPIIRLRQIGVIQGKIITVFHGYDITSYLNKQGEQAYNLLFNLGDLFLPISELWKKRLIEIGCNDKKIVVHRMGIDCQKFAFAIRESRPNSQVNIVTVARLVEKKGVEYGIRAVAKLVNSNLNVKYTIVGDGPLKKKLQKLIKKLRLSDTVQLLGSQPQQEVIKILKNSDIFLAPSVTSKSGDQEGIPVVLMETMAMGLPVVSTEHSGIPELVKDGISGFLVPERDVDTLSDKLNYLVKHPEVWSSMGVAGRAFVEENYDIDKLNHKLVNIYQDLLNENSRVGLR